MALAGHGVPGCLVTQDDLGPFAQFDDSDCECRSGWLTCCECCWGFDEGGGCWMRDWDSDLSDVEHCAQKAARRPLAKVLLESFRAGTPFPGLTVTEEAMARLVDIAILIGDPDLAESCRKHCDRPPLRRWSLRFLVDHQLHHFKGLHSQTLKAAVLAGWAVEDGKGWVVHNVGFVPFWALVGCCGDAQLSEHCRQFQRKGWLQPWSPKSRCNELGLLLLNVAPCPESVCPLKRLWLAKSAGVPVNEFRVTTTTCCVSCGTWPWQREESKIMTMLDVGVASGDLAYSKACGAMGMDLSPDMVFPRCQRCHDSNLRFRTSPFVLKLFIKDFDLVWDTSVSERIAAAGAALGAALTASCRRAACEMGFGLYQAMTTWAGGRKALPALVNEVLDFAADLPKWVDALPDDVRPKVL